MSTEPSPRVMALALQSANERAERWKVRCEEARATVARVESLADTWGALPVWGPDERGLFILDGVDHGDLMDELRDALVGTTRSPIARRRQRRDTHPAATRAATNEQGVPR